jgi:hypothetical protein
VSRAGIKALFDRSAAMYERLNRKGVKDICKILRRHFGALLLVEDIGQPPAVGRRRRGSRSTPITTARAWFPCGSPCAGPVSATSF